MRFVPLGFALMFGLSGCALPTAVTIASFAADGVSYIATGKSTTDHALSVIAQEDCAMARALEERPICVPDLNASIRTVALASKTETPSRSAAKKIPVEAAPQAPRAKTPAFFLVHKDAMTGPRPPAQPRLVAKAEPPALAPADSLQLVEKSAPKEIDPAQLLAKISRISLPKCGEGPGMAPAGQCRLGPGV